MKTKVSNTGYLDNSPDRFNDSILVPSNSVTMDGVTGKKVLMLPIGPNKVGNPILASPGENYYFPDYAAVLEMAMPPQARMHYEKFAKGGPVNMSIPAIIEVLQTGYVKGRALTDAQRQKFAQKAGTNIFGEYEEEEEEYERDYSKKGGPTKGLKKGRYTNKNIQSSINELLYRRNETLYGPSGKRYYKPYKQGGWLDKHDLPKAQVYNSIVGASLNTNDFIYTPEELLKYKSIYDKKIEECKKGDAGCLEQANNFYNLYVAPKLGSPSTWKMSEKMGISSGKGNPRMKHYGIAADSWDYAGASKEAGAKINLAAPIKDPYQIQKKLKSMTKEEQKKYWKDMNLPIGTLVNFGDAGLSSGYGNGLAYNVTQGLVPANHSTRVIGYDPDGVPYLYDYGHITPITDPTFESFPLTIVSSPKDIQDYTYENLSKENKLQSDRFLRLKLDTEGEEYDEDEYIPFVKSLEKNKNVFANAFDMSDEEYNNYAKHAAALALTETKGGDDLSIRLWHGFLPTLSYVTDKLGLGDTQGITQINPKVLFGKKSLADKLETVGIVKTNYDPWNPDHIAAATLALLKDNKSVQDKNAKKSGNKANLSEAEKTYYQWSMPRTLRIGDAKGESAKIKRYLENYNKIKLNNSGVYAEKKYGGWLDEYQPGGSLTYDQWKKKYKLVESPDYNLKRAWELGYTPDATGHLPTVDEETNIFLKTRNHPTLRKELDWYNSPKGETFRNQYDIDSSGTYFRYVPKNNNLLKRGGWLDKYQKKGEVNFAPENWNKKYGKTAANQPKLIAPNFPKSEQEARARLEKEDRAKVINYQDRIDYYTKRGMPLNEAVTAVRIADRQMNRPDELKEYIPKSTTQKALQIAMNPVDAFKQYNKYGYVADSYSESDLFSPTGILNLGYQALTIPGQIVSMTNAGYYLPKDIAQGNLLSAVGNAFDVLPGVSGALLSGLPGRAGKYLTTKTPLRNAYKINPLAVKDPDLILTRTQKPGQTADLARRIELEEWGNKYGFENMNPDIKAEYTRISQPGYGQGFSSNLQDIDVYTNPYMQATRGYEGFPEILKIRLPAKEAQKFKVKTNPVEGYVSYAPEREYLLPKNYIESAEVFNPTVQGTSGPGTITDIVKTLEAERVSANTPHWLRGYKQVDTPSQLPGSPNSETNIFGVNTIEGGPVKYREMVDTDELMSQHKNLSDLLDKELKEAETRWSSPEGRRRIQGIIDGDPKLKNQGVTVDDYINNLRAVKSDNKNAYAVLQNIKDLEKVKKNIYNEFQTNRYNKEEGWDVPEFTEQQLDDRLAEVDKAISKLYEKYDEISPQADYSNAYVRKNKQTQISERIGIGPNLDLKDAKTIAHHEIPHILGRTKGATSIDKELEGLDLLTSEEPNLFTSQKATGKGNKLYEIFNKDNEYFKRALDYFKTGSYSTEKMPFLAEVRADMLEKGIINNVYDEITEDMLKKHYGDYMSKITGEKYPLRIYDLIKANPKNFKILTSTINKIPAALPVIGAGTYLMNGEQEQSQQEEYKKGGSTPSNSKLYSKVLKDAKKKFKIWPNPFAKAWVEAEYKKRGGDYSYDMKWKYDRGGKTPPDPDVAREMLQNRTDLTSKQRAYFAEIAGTDENGYYRDDEGNIVDEFGNILEYAEQEDLDIEEANAPEEGSEESYQRGGQIEKNRYKVPTQVHSRGYEPFNRRK